MRPKQSERALSWRSGGWVLLTMALLVLAVVAWLVVPVLRSSSRAIGDGQNVESYGFDLSNFALRREQLAAAGFPKDGVPVLVAPRTMRGDAVAAFNQERRGKYLVSDDRVIGVVVNGEARAYPMRVLNWHEIVNDTLGGVPIAVTYHPLCDSVVVFDRRVGGKTLEFGISGLLYNSNQLLYDRRARPLDESLWSQLLARAVAGPAEEEGATLEIHPASLARWERWLRLHPDTTVLEPEPLRLKRYGRNPYGNYYLTGRPRFPVDPLPSEQTLRWMQPMVVIEQDGRSWVQPVGAGVVSEQPFAGVRVSIDGGTPPSVIVEAGSGTAVYYSLWFAWYAARPADSL